MKLMRTLSPIAVGRRMRSLLTETVVRSLAVADFRPKDLWLVLFVETFPPVQRQEPVAAQG